MCTGLEIAAIVAATAGSAAQYSAQQQSQAAQDRAQMAEMDRQRKLREESIAQFNKSADAMEPGKQLPDLQDAVATRREAFDRSIFPTAGGSYDIGNTNAPAQIADTSNLASAQLGGELSRSSNARARLEGLGDLLLKNQLRQAKSAEEIARIRDASRGSGDVFQAENVAAGRKGQGLGQLGDLLVGIGGVAAGAARGAGATPGTSVSPTASSMPYRARTSIDRIAPTSPRGLYSSMGR